MTRRFFGNLLGVHQPTSGIFTLGELGPTTTGALTRPQLRWGGMLGRSAILGGGTGGPLSISLNPVSSSGTNSGTSSGTVAIVKGAGNVTSGQERWNTSSLANTGSFTLANEAEVTFEVWGAAGGSETNIYPALGGGGEYRKATFTLAPGTYYYLCGAGGGCGDTTAYRVGTGGFGGGGVGSTNNSSITGTSATAFGNGGYNGAANYSSANSGGGGGLTGIFTSATPSQSSALIVAGGGGGAGYNGAAGLPGGDTSSRSGTASSGGIAPANAEDGAAGKGGASNTFGGGGGGGYWGGAGGGSSTNSPGGGGGRGYTDGAGFNTTTTAGSGNTPGGKSSANYVSGYGASNGSVWTSGGGGLIAISAVEVSARFTTTGLIKLSELQQIRLGPSSASTVFPVFSSGSTASFPEGGTGTVYTAVAADSDNNAITFGLGSSKDEALFSISASGQVTFLATPDFESPADGNADNVYDIDIIATNGVNATTQTVAITVSDQNDPPVITSASTASFQENGTGAAYTITATDPNGDGITFTLGNSNDEALFNIVNNLVTFNTSPDFENPSDANADNAYIIEVIATDSAGNSASQLVTINVTDDPTDVTAPVISGASSISAQENATTASTILETFTATGGGTLSWSLTGTDAADFSINSSGELTFSSPPDFESPADANTDNSYNVTINVSNEAGSDTLAVTVAVTDDTADNPIAPQISGPSTATFQENGTGAVATYTIQAGTAPITFSLSGTDAARFSISSSGVVTFNSPPDFESPTDSGGNNVYDLTVTASNAGGSTSTSLTVTVTNDTSDDYDAIINGSAYNFGTSGNYTLNGLRGDHSNNQTSPQTATITVSAPITLAFYVWGAGGGKAYGSGGAGPQPGGAGGRAIGRVQLQPGTTYSILAGNGGKSASTGYTDGKGGFGGGGGGGAESSGTGVNGSAFGSGGSGANGSGRRGGGGGGLSGVFNSTFRNAGTCLIIAGGGGGGGAPESSTAGAGGGTTGQNATYTAGATQSAGGYPFSNKRGDGSGSADGIQGRGGRGGYNSSAASGGGGGGWYGGGGGRVDTNSGDGGSGGSGYINSTYVTNSSNTQGTDTSPPSGTNYGNSAALGGTGSAGGGPGRVVVQFVSKP